jgi:ectoine hydroxylase-related dioxygenase (phytanoyl-CoA dioxygenase family)
MKALSRRDVAEYERHGICFPIDVLTEDEVRDARSGFERLEEYFGGRPGPAQLRHLHLFFPWARQLTMHPRVLDAVEDLIGPDVLVHSATVFCKHPKDETYVSWHQDGHYWNLADPGLVSAWVALTPSKRENGCMKVVRGSHLRGRLPHQESSVSERNLLTSGLEIEVRVDESEATYVLLEPGQMSLHHVNIVHGSGRNQSDDDRIGFAIRYVASHVRQQTVHPPVLLARGANRGDNFTIFEDQPLDTIADAVAACATFCGRVERMRRSDETVTVSAAIPQSRS